MPKFLTRQEIYRILQRESPMDVYPDGAPTAFISTASMDAKAKVFASIYQNLETVYENYFPQSADERIEDWEVKVFGEPSTGGLTLLERQSRILAKLRKRPKISKWEILTLIAGYIPEGKFVQIVELCSPQGKWVLGRSRLGSETILGLGSPGEFNPQTCSDLVRQGWVLGRAKLGTQTALGKDYRGLYSLQAQAYGYEVRIFDYELTGDTLEQALLEIKKAEPARSSFVMKQNLDLTDYGLTVPVSDVNEFNLVDCITRDSTSTTGYSGRRKV